MTKVWVALAFIAGMSFQYSLTGEYSRYGLEVMDIINDCEYKEGRECDIIAAPVSEVDFIQIKPYPSSSFSPSEIS